MLYYSPGFRSFPLFSLSAFWFCILPGIARSVNPVRFSFSRSHEVDRRSAFFSFLSNVSLATETKHSLFHIAIIYILTLEACRRPISTSVPYPLLSQSRTSDPILHALRRRANRSFLSSSGLLRLRLLASEALYHRHYHVNRQMKISSGRP